MGIFIWCKDLNRVAEFASRRTEQLMHDLRRDRSLEDHRQAFEKALGVRDGMVGRTHGPAVLEAFGQLSPRAQRKVLAAVKRGYTEAGMMVDIAKKRGFDRYEIADLSRRANDLQWEYAQLSGLSALHVPNGR